jgi:hypothetical protein
MYRERSRPPRPLAEILEGQRDRWLEPHLRRSLLRAARLLDRDAPPEEILDAPDARDLVSRARLRATRDALVDCGALVRTQGPGRDLFDRRDFYRPAAPRGSR